MDPRVKPEDDDRRGWVTPFFAFHLKNAVRTSCRAAVVVVRSRHLDPDGISLAFAKGRFNRKSVLSSPKGVLESFQKRLRSMFREEN
jgi:hypothetical protein